MRIPAGMGALRSFMARSGHRPIRSLISCCPRLYSSATTLAGVRLPTLDDLSLLPGDNVVVAMSGGVDSSVTLALLSQLDLNLSVLFMRNWDPLLSETRDDSTSSSSSFALAYNGAGDMLSPCEWERDWADVRRVAEHMGVPSSAVKFVDLTKEYWSRVFEPSIATWDSGRTPNPDVWCNKEIKFGALLEHIPEGHYLATGEYEKRHYARVKRSPEGTSLHRALDINKDQTYYLSQVGASQLSRAVFPLADIPKPQVRDLARAFNLPTAERAESMGVCFIGERGKFGDFVCHFITLDGTRVSPHRGDVHYTIGQRARLGGMDGRWFVARKAQGDGNDILIVPSHDHPALQCTSLSCDEFTWIASEPPSEAQEGLDVTVQVRHRMRAVPARVWVRDGRVEVVFETPVAAVAAGQVAGVWRGTECLGSGVIERTRCMDEEERTQGIEEEGERRQAATG